MTAFLLQYLPVVIFLGIAAALGVLTVNSIYEWKKGAPEWE
jgi:NADH:ubiquinone oxidoreductase subunit 3 (subunit A)